MTIAAEQQEYSNVPEQLKAHVFKRGVSWNPTGKPKWSVSLKKYAQKYIQGLSEEEKQEFMEWIPKIEIWRMAEGLPHSTSDVVVREPPKPIADV